jgi:hypothetical protein
MGMDLGSALKLSLCLPVSGAVQRVQVLEQRSRLVARRIRPESSLSRKRVAIMLCEIQDEFILSERHTLKRKGSGK